jgi:hypothetical protein
MVNFETAKMGILCYKTSHNDDKFLDASSLRWGKSGTFTPPKAYSGPIPISKENKDFMGLKFLPPIFHRFHRDLPTASSVQDIYPNTAQDGLDNEENEYQKCNRHICVCVTTKSVLWKLSYCKALGVVT